MRFGVGGCCVMKRWWRGLISLQGAARPSKAGLAFEKSERGAFSTCALFTLTRVWSDTMRTIALGAVTELQVARGSAESAIRSFPRSASSRPLRHTLYHKTPPQQHPGMWKPNPTDRITEYESRLSIPDPVPCNLATSRRLVTIPEITISVNRSTLKAQATDSALPSSTASCHPVQSLHASLRIGHSHDRTGNLWISRTSCVFDRFKGQGSSADNRSNLTTTSARKSAPFTCD